MFARILQFGLKVEMKKDFIDVFKNQVLPILKKQVGFVEVLPFFPEKVTDQTTYNVSLWDTKADAERFEKETYPKVFEILKPFLTTGYRQALQPGDHAMSALCGQPGRMTNRSPESTKINGFRASCSACV